LVKVASDLTSKIKDDTSADEARDIELAYDALMYAYDGYDTEKDGRTRSGNRNPGGADHRRPGVDEVSIGPDGADAAEPVFALRSEQRMADYLRERGAPAQDGLTLGRYLRAMVVGARSDAERRALAEGTDSAGGFTVPDILSARLIDLMRARTVAIRAGAMTVPLTSDSNAVAKVASDPVPAWRAEAGAVSESDPTFARIVFAPKSLAVLVKASRELLDDSLNMESQLPLVIASAMAVELDRVALFGSGSGNEPRGLANTSGIETVVHNATLTSYAPLIQARTKILSNNALGVSAFVMSPRDEGTLAGLVDTTNQPLRIPPAIANVPMLTSTSVPTDLGSDSPPAESTILAGWFAHLLIGMRSNIRIEVLRERYADTLQYGFIAHLRADIAVEQPKAFCAITGIG
jgi:HK97 family phage major capsid protein